MWGQIFLEFLLRDTARPPDRAMNFEKSTTASLEGHLVFATPFSQNLWILI